MTTNFIISAYQKLWDKNARDLYIIEPYVHHVLEKEKQLPLFNKIEVAPFRRKSREDIDSDSRYVDDKYNKYIPILSARLNEIHGTNHREAFWKKSLSLAFIRYITLFHDVFEKCELYLDRNNHTANILSPASYYQPMDFEDHRHYFQNTDIGQEQIFSLYARLFYPGEFEEIQQHPAQFDSEINRPGLKSNEVLTVNTIIKKFAKKWISSLSKKVIVSDINIKVGIVGSYFSGENLAKLIKQSDAIIYPLDWSIRLDHEGKDISWDKRGRLAEFDDDFDRFDKYFFSTIPYCMPRVFVEHFHDIENKYLNLLKGYPSLRYIVSEGWINDTFMSIFLAFAREKGIIHINNEHNCYFHPFAGSFISYVIEMSDIFITLGWSFPQNQKVKQGASLYAFSTNKKIKKKYEILYVSCPAFAKIPHYCSAWGNDCENASKHLQFVGNFLGKLSLQTLGRIVYRRYPKEFLTNPMVYDKEYIIQAFLNNTKAFADTSIPSKIQMLQSNLVIIDYISTSYIEALVMNIPTVFFWNKDTYYLNDNYLDFFDVLVEAGICQTNPVQAAHFVEGIIDAPEKWWFSEKVQAARNTFLNRNLGKPEDMIDYLLQLTKT